MNALAKEEFSTSDLGFNFHDTPMTSLGAAVVVTPVTFGVLLLKLEKQKSVTMKYTMKHLLIIDDDAKIVSFLKGFFESHGIKVSTGSSGNEMWQALESEKIDFVILDALMPGTNENTLCSELKSQSNVPTVLMTALDGETNIIVGLEAGADDYVVNPFNPCELLARMRAVSRRNNSNFSMSQTNISTIFSFSSFQFDTRRRELRASENVLVHLSRTEFELLKIFVHRPSEAIDRNTLSELLRGHELEAFDRSIDLHVSRLRSKLGPRVGGGNFIKTVRGTGYMFDLEVTESQYGLVPV
ncbi:response regulator [Octadecabacter antarcticus]|nr:response regulator transcription factor [Octadecabacter antarcticus]